MDLYNVATVDGAKNPYATDLTFRGIQYEHVPNADVGGLFGTFRMKLTLDNGHRRQTRTMLHKSQVVVFNVKLEKKQKVLTMRSLRSLALALPGEYPFPARADIPESHLHFSDDENDDSEETRAPAGRQARRGGRSSASSARGRGRRGRNARGGTRGAARGGTSRVDASSSSDSEDDDEDDEDEDEGEEDDDDDELEEDETFGDVDFQPPEPVAERSNVPLLRGPTVEPKMDTVIALNMVGDPEYTQLKWPVGLAYVCSIAPFKVSWFVLPQSQFTARVGRERSGFKTSNKFLTFKKYWKDPNWFKTLKGKKPTEQQIIDQWYSSDAHKNWIMQVDVPQDDARKIRMADDFKLPMSFVTETLIPACERAECVQ